MPPAAKPRVLIFGIDHPTTPLVGWSLRSAGLESQLAQLADVSFVALGENPPPPLGRRDCPTVLALDAKLIERGLHCITEHMPDLVIFDRSVCLLELAEAVAKQHPRLPLAFDFHNVESDLWYAMQRDSRASPAAAITAAVRDADRRAAALARVVFTCSARDATLLQTLCDTARTVVLPNPAPVVAPLPVPAQGPMRLLFVGLFSYPPNNRAARFLLLFLYPLLVLRGRGARLVLAGRYPGRKLRLLARLTASELHDSPPDLGPVYASAHACLLPLSRGGGTRLKALEALAYGRPLIATAKAVEGLDLRPDHDYLLAEGATGFLRAIRRLQDDPALIDRLGKAGPAHAERLGGAALRLAALREGLRLAGLPG